MTIHLIVFYSFMLTSGHRNYVFDPSILMKVMSQECSGNFFKLGPSVHLDSRMNWLNFGFTHIYLIG